MLRLWLLILIAAAAPAQSLYEISGRIRPEGQATVTLWGATQPFTASVLSDENGRFTFKKLVAGTYTLAVFQAGRGEARRTIEVGPGLADSRHRIQITLALKDADFDVTSDRRRHSINARELAIPERALRDYVDAERDLERRDVEAAEKHLEHAVELSPRFANAWNTLGTIAYQTRRFPLAEERFRQALKQDPASYEPLVNLGGVLVTLHKLDEALSVNVQAAMTRPNDALANSQLGMTYFELGQFDAAVKYLERARKLDPAHFSHPQLFLAEIHLRRGQKAEAASVLEEFLAHHPDYPQAEKMRQKHRRIATIVARVRLPIDELLPDILEHLRAANHLVLEAPPGAGKTTRVPPALLGLDAREVLVLEPRRLAARLAARYVAGELGEAVGGTVGYQVRFEEVAGPRTRLRFLTEGVLTRRLLSDPHLERVGCVVLDEFHERHVEGDVALALLRRLQRTRRPDLRLVVMSATLDAAPVAEYLAADGTRPLPVLRSLGRQHALETEYTPHSAAPLEEQVAGALESLSVRLAARGMQGHVLVFLPGSFEIRRAQNACAAVARRHGWQLLPLYGDQSPEEQDRAVAPCAQTKIILSTNVAESSITIDGVHAVIDSGLARVASHSPWSGLPSLTVTRISQASANQRAGRAGRTGPGRAIRLYPLEDFLRRPAQDVPQILREDLAPVALLLGAMNTDLESLDWLDAPPPAAVDHARGLLRDLGATGAVAREMARYPLHPRLSRLMVEARRRGVAREGCAVAALLSAGERLPARAPHASRSDLLVLLEGEWSPYAARLFRQLGGSGSGRSSSANEDALLLSILTAFPDRVARRRQGSDLQLASGGAAQLAVNSTVTDADLLVAVEAEDRKDQKAPLVRLASAIEPEWLLDLFPDRLREVSTLEWNRGGERVEAATSLMFDQVAIETRRTAPDAEQAGAYLARKALEAGLARFADVDQIAALQARIQFAAQHGAVTPLDDAAIEAALGQLAVGLKSFAELESAARGGGLLRAIEHRMPAGTRRLLDEIAPTSIRLPRGRQVPVHYEPGQPPWIASRMQDFFGMRDTPAIGRGAVPVVVRLLAPNQRPVQMTSDLAGFWQRLYPQVRKELSRRYPKHAWPENPLA